MTQTFSNVYSLYHKQRSLKFETIFIIFHYDIFRRKIKWQNIMPSYLFYFFIMSKCDDYLKHFSVR